MQEREGLLRVESAANHPSGKRCSFEGVRFRLGSLRGSGLVGARYDAIQALQII
jgi:hypothetical protein